MSLQARAGFFLEPSGLMMFSIWLLIDLRVASTSMSCSRSVLDASSALMYLRGSGPFSWEKPAKADMSMPGPGGPGGPGIPGGPGGPLQGRSRDSMKASMRKCWMFFYQFANISTHSGPILSCTSTRSHRAKSTWQSISSILSLGSNRTRKSLGKGHFHSLHLQSLSKKQEVIIRKTRRWIHSPDLLPDPHAQSNPAHQQDPFVNKKFQ